MDFGKMQYIKVKTKLKKPENQNEDGLQERCGICLDTFDKCLETFDKCLETLDTCLETKEKP